MRSRSNVNAKVARRADCASGGIRCVIGRTIEEIKAKLVWRLHKLGPPMTLGNVREQGCG
jgi:hypothetical protein